MAEGAKLPFLPWAAGAEGIKLCQGWAFAVGWGTVSTSWYQSSCWGCWKNPLLSTPSWNRLGFRTAGEGIFLRPVRHTSLPPLCVLLPLTSTPALLPPHLWILMPLADWIIMWLGIEWSWLLALGFLGAFKGVHRLILEAWQHKGLGPDSEKRGVTSVGKDLLEFSSPSDPRGGQVWQPSQNNSCGMVSNRSVGFWGKKN